MIDKLNHYSIENNPTIYDEEALTVLQLVARLTGKFNELIADHNKLEEAIKELYGEEIARLVGEWLEAHPEITTTVQDGELTIHKLVVGTLGYVTPQMFGAKADGQTDDTKAIQEAMASHNRVYFDGKFLITQPLQLRDNMEVWGNKDGYIRTDKDISIFVGDTAKAVSECYIHNLHIINAHNRPSHYQLDLCNANMFRIAHCKVVTQSSEGGAVGGINIYSTVSGIYSPLIDSCDLRNSSIILAVTDGYISNTNVWAQNRMFALNIQRSSQQIVNCQFVGGNGNCAVLVQDTVHGWNVGQVRISNCFFDGSHADIQSGVGLKAVNMINSVITGNTFWQQKEEGAVLENCGYCAITGNVFTKNGINNSTQGSYNRSEGMYDLDIIGQAFYNTISGNTFDTDNFYIKQGAINTAKTSGVVTGNCIFGNAVQSFDQYIPNAINFTEAFLAHNNTFGNWHSGNQPQSMIHGNLQVGGTLHATTVETEA